MARKQTQASVDINAIVAQAVQAALAAVQAAPAPASKPAKVKAPNVRDVQLGLLQAVRNARTQSADELIRAWRAALDAPHPAEADKRALVGRQIARVALYDWSPAKSLDYVRKAKGDTE